MAAGLKGGSVYTTAEMNNHAKLLMDSGVFDHLTYKFDGVDLISGHGLSQALEAVDIVIEAANPAPTDGSDLELEGRVKLLDPIEDEIGRRLLLIARRL